MMSFGVDDTILSTCLELGDWPLSRVFLKNNEDYPWLILVPRVNNVQDIDQLPQSLRYLLMNEISQLSSIVRMYFKPDKLNIASLGNIVSQLHVHVVARFAQDKLWPYSIWQAGQTTTPYAENSLASLVTLLRDEVALACKLLEEPV